MACTASSSYSQDGLLVCASIRVYSIVRLTKEAHFMLRTFPHSIVSHAVVCNTHTTLQVGLYQCDSTVYSVRNYSLGYPCISVKIRLSTVKSISRKSLLVACCMALTRCVETHFSKSSSSRMCLVATKTMVLMGLLE